MTWEPELEELERRRAFALEMGGPEGVERQRARGKLTVRERIDAFAAALSALGMTADELLADTDLLTSVLTYHVVSGAVDAATVVGLTSATTLNGAAISIKVVDGTVYLNDTVKVVTTDIMACNGIIHVIDAVLLPPAADSGAGTGAMPNTGSGSTTLALLAGGLLVAGVGVFAVSRRRPATVRVNG